MAAPTEKQYRRLLPLGGGAAGLSWTKRDTQPLIRHGWVTADIRPGETYYQFIRLTPDGYRALALAVEKYGLPDLGPKPVTTVRVCADCGSDRYRFKNVSADEHIGRAA